MKEALLSRLNKMETTPRRPSSPSDPPSATPTKQPYVGRPAKKLVSSKAASDVRSSLLAEDDGGKWEPVKGKSKKKLFEGPTQSGVLSTPGAYAVLGESNETETEEQLRQPLEGDEDEASLPGSEATSKVKPAEIAPQEKGKGKMTEDAPVSGRTESSSETQRRQKSTSSGSGVKADSPKAPSYSELIQTPAPSTTSPASRLDRHRVPKPRTPEPKISLNKHSTTIAKGDDKPKVTKDASPKVEPETEKAPQGDEQFVVKEEPPVTKPQAEEKPAVQKKDTKPATQDAKASKQRSTVQGNDEPQPSHEVPGSMGETGSALEDIEDVDDEPSGTESPTLASPNQDELKQQLPEKFILDGKPKYTRDIRMGRMQSEHGKLREVPQVIGNLRCYLRSRNQTSDDSLGQGS